MGTDIVYIPRIQAIVERWGDRFLQRVYTPAEQQDYGYAHASDLSRSSRASGINASHVLNRSSRRNASIQYLAGRWAAKEAVAKALGTGFGEVAYTDVEVRRLPSGAPQVILYGAAAELVAKWGDGHWHLSISHDGDYSVATAILVFSP